MFPHRLGLRERGLDDGANGRCDFRRHGLTRGEDEDARGDALGLGQLERRVGLQGAVGLHAMAAGPEIFSRQNVFGVEHGDQFIPI